MNFIKTALVTLSFAAAGAAFAGPLDQGMVGGYVKSDVKIGKLDMNNKAGVGYAKQELNVGSVNGAKVLGAVDLRVQAKDISMTNKTTLGVATQEANIGSLK